MHTLSYMQLSSMCFSHTYKLSIYTILLCCMRFYKHTYIYIYVDHCTSYFQVSNFICGMSCISKLHNFYSWGWNGSESNDQWRARISCHSFIIWEALKEKWPKHIYIYVFIYIYISTFRWWFFIVMSHPMIQKLVFQIKKLKPKTNGSFLYNLQCGTNEANRISRVGDNPYVLKFSSSKGLNNDPYDQHFTFTLGFCRLKKKIIA